MSSTDFRFTVSLLFYTLLFPIQSNIDLLILRLESTDAEKERAIANFMSYTNFTLHSTNVTTESNAASAYKAFKKTVKIPEDVLDKAYSAKITRYFYTDEEISAMRHKWEQPVR